MAKYNIEVDLDTCVGCGACTASCQDNFEMVNDKAHPKNSEVDDLGCNMEAAEVCPVNAIHITQDGKKLI